MFGAISALALSMSSAQADARDASQPVAQPAAQLQAQPGTIVVTAPTRNYRRALDACLARRCPVNEDVDATTALAESLFLDGEYEDAHRVLRQSLRRNRGQAAAFPEPVSDLYRANARVTRHLGLDREAARSTRETLDALQAGLPTEDHRHFTARLEIAQMLTGFRRFDEAQRELRELGDLAEAAGRDDVVATAMLRRIWIDHVRDRNGTALRRLTALAAGEDRGAAIGARLLMVRIYSERGDTARADAIMAELSRQTARRQLLFSPSYELVQREDGQATQARTDMMYDPAGMAPMLTANLQNRMVGSMSDKWIDVGFWVEGDGTVSNLDIVRTGTGTLGWEPPLLQSIRGRRYTASADGERTYRLERYTYTSEVMILGGGTGQRIAGRSPRARVEYLDLSDPGAAATASN